MKDYEGIKWALLALIAFCSIYLGKINYQHRHIALFPLITLATVGLVILVFFLLSRKDAQGPPSPPV